MQSPLRASVVLVAIAMLACATSSAGGLELTEHNLQVTEAATAMSQKVTGTNFGDSIIFRNPLLDFNTEQNIGHTEGICIYTVALDAVGSYELECDMTFVLGNGTFTVTGQWLEKPSAMAVVGGTGVFSGARGVAQQSTLKHDEATGANLFALNIRMYSLPEIKLPALGPHKFDTGVTV
jgi:hypothetical protein